MSTYRLNFKILSRRHRDTEMLKIRWVLPWLIPQFDCIKPSALGYWSWSTGSLWQGNCRSGALMKDGITRTINGDHDADLRAPVTL